MNKLELLMPGGSLEKIKYAIAYGADAVYAGVPKYSLRARENEFFDIDLVKEAVDYTHSQGKKIYLTCNIYAHNNKIKSFMSAMEEMASLKPDAFIMTDPGLIMLTREKFPDIEIHLSTQANNTNWAQVKFWKDFGIKRAILARELTVQEIAEIHEKVPDIELEAFVHGSICMAYSGRCLLSNYLSYRDANQGTCSHSCRWGFKVLTNEAEPDDVITDYVPISGDFYLEEPERRGEMMPIDEDEYGTYIMNSKDLCAVDYLEELKNAGIISFKVEGRNKTEYYASLVARAYRKGLDLIEEGKNIDNESREWMLEELGSTANRGFIPGFYARNAKAAAQELEKDHCVQTHLYAAKLLRFNPESRVVELEVKNRMDAGDELEFISPKTSFKMKVSDVFYKGHPDWNPYERYENQIKKSAHAHGGGENIFIKIPEEIDINEFRENWKFTVLRMKYKEPVTLRARN
jgi:U32 family peptidase